MLLLYPIRSFLSTVHQTQCGFLQSEQVAWTLFILEKEQ